MKTNLNKWLKSTCEMYCHGNSYYQEVRNHLECNDGTTLSVQASESHYCTPRRNQPEVHEYSKVEVWCVSKPVPDSWYEYGDPEDNPYAYIPVSMVEEFIDSCGGIKDFTEK